MDFRIGHGYDAHRLVGGRKLILGGAAIDFELGLDGHSDADVLCHAIIDALLGAAAMGDIGQLFPDNDDTYKNASSITLLAITASLIGKAGFCVSNIDSTIIAEAPRLAGYIPNMRQNIAGAAGLELDQVSVKATTEEKMGFTGRAEGIAAHSVVLIKKILL